MATNALQIVLLGVADRAILAREGQTNLFKWNVLGLKDTVVSFIYPLNFMGLNLGVAIRNATESSTLDLRLRDSENQEAGFLRIDLRAGTPDAPPTGTDGPLALVLPDHWMIAFLPIKSPITINHPGIYRVVRVDGAAEETIGSIYFALAEPLPLSAERAAAIRSDPAAVKFVRVELGCKNCPSKLLTYAALERNKKQEDEGYTWYQDISDRFTCKCGSTSMDATSIRRNLFAYLGGRTISDEHDLDCTPLYETAALDSLQNEFCRLLDRDVPEEALQKFIEDNPILLHQFPAERIFFKPPILTGFRADFAILTTQKELVLIEIETAGTRLLKRDGGQASELSHALDQVRDWLHIIDEHRLAFLDSLKIGREAVSIIRGVVIAGRDHGYDAEHLRRLRGVDRGRVSLLTFDDMIFGLSALRRRIKTL